jgi:hypothetical protein
MRKEKMIMNDMEKMNKEKIVAYFKANIHDLLVGVPITTT